MSAIATHFVPETITIGEEFKRTIPQLHPMDLLITIDLQASDFRNCSGPEPAGVKETSLVTQRQTVLEGDGFVKLNRKSGSKRPQPDASTSISLAMDFLSRSAE